MIPNPDGGGWIASPVTASNAGTLTALADNNGVPEGTVYEFYEKVVGGHPFVLAADGHHIPDDDTTWVGRGWLTLDPEGGNTGPGMDWLFMGMPEPATALLFAPGLLGLRRRR